MNHEIETNDSKTNETTNLQTIVVIGNCLGTYHNGEVSKEFSSKVLAMVRPNGSLVVQNLSEGIRPICYIGEGAEISLARNVLDAEIELIATTDDGQHLSLMFEEVYSLCGVPASQEFDSLALTILRCVSDLEGKYGRVRIARLLTGSMSKCVLTMGIDELRAYGVAKDVSQKETLYLIDWLIDEGYIQFAEDETYPTLTISEKGRETLEGAGSGDELPLSSVNTVYDGEDFNVKVEKLKNWRKSRAEIEGRPIYLILQNRTIKELAIKNPESIEDLQNVYGIGDVKATEFGPELLSILNDGGLQ